MVLCHISSAFSFAFSKDWPHVVCRLLVLFGISYQILLPNPRRALVGPHLQLIESSWSTKTWFTASRIQGLVAAGLQQEKEVVHHLVCISLTIVYPICSLYNNFKSVTESIMVFGTRRKNTSGWSNEMWAWGFHVTQWRSKLWFTLGGLILKYFMSLTLSYFFPFVWWAD